MKKISLGGVALVCAFCSLYAQDPRERNYFYEILDPKHEPKPLVEGFAQERITENLNRGLAVAPSRDGKSVYLSWRLLASDAPATAFHVYREVGGKPCRLTKKAVSRTCDFVDTAPHAQAVYWVEAVAKGQKPVVSEKRKVVLSDLKPYTSIRLKDNAKAGKIALADLNGDGTYDYIVRTPETNVDPGMPGDTTGKTYKISAYLSDGTYLWTYDMGPGIEPGIWYSPFIVYDFNGDGKAEVAIKTAGADYVKNEKGRVCGGSEYLSVLDGMTGQEIDRVDWPERNDRYGNLIRQNRNQMGAAYLDGKTPFILAARGTYKLMVVDAWMLKNGKLERAWRWDGDEENPVVRSMGAHSMVTADVDGDGYEELYLVQDGGYMAAMVALILDGQGGKLRAELSEFPTLTAYDNGCIRADASHNHGLAGDFWPYVLYRYDAESDSYQRIAQVNAWDGRLYAQDYAGNPFPKDVDVSGAGIVYYVAENGESYGESYGESGTPDVAPMDQADFQKWEASWQGSGAVVEFSLENEIVTDDLLTQGAAG